MAVKAVVKEVVKVVRWMLVVMLNDWCWETEELKMTVGPTDQEIFIQEFFRLFPPKLLVFPLGTEKYFKSIVMLSIVGVNMILKWIEIYYHRLLQIFLPECCHILGEVLIKISPHSSWKNLSLDIVISPQMCYNTL